MKEILAIIIVIFLAIIVANIPHKIADYQEKRARILKEQETKQLNDQWNKILKARGTVNE